MTETTHVSGQPRDAITGGLFYRLVWKWHFLASLYVLPFMFILSLTGGIYLFKPQIDAWLYADAMSITPAATILPYEDQVKAVDDQVGITRLRGITSYEDPARSTLIEFNDAHKVRSFAWVNPYSGAVLKVAERDKMAMQIVRKLHGELLLGGFGTKFVEIAAHWSIVMVVTGLFLWWPRGTRSLGHALRLPQGRGRAWWRETHMFTGFLAAILILPIIVTGLPWTDVWGGGLSYVQEQTGTKSKSLRFGGDAPNSQGSAETPIAYQEVFDIAAAAGLVAPYEMRPPKNDVAAFWLRSSSVERTAQTELVIDQYSGAVLKRLEFMDHPGLAKAISYGISFHQGELYGWVNTAQNLIAALLGILLSISGFIAWWMRRPRGTLGVPAAPQGAPSMGIVSIICALAVMFPLMGATLLLALALDWLLFRRLRWFQNTETKASS